MEKQTMSELIEQVGSWSQTNFGDKQAPLLGVAEEIGELCHGILKNLQRIRGFEALPKFRAHIWDAFGDTMIYLCNFAYLHGAFFAFNRNRLDVPRAIDRHPFIMLSYALQCLCTMLNQASTEGREMDDWQKRAVADAYSVYCQRFCNAMEQLAMYYEISLEQATFETWRKHVAKRDWKKDSAEGGKHGHDQK